MGSLAKRLEELTGPDREVDIEIAKVAGLNVSEYDHRVYFEPDPGASWRLVPAYTASLDAAIGLVERVAPDWTIASIGQDDRKEWHAELREGYRTSYSTVKLAGAKTPAIALLLALLQSLPGRE